MSFKTIKRNGFYHLLYFDNNGMSIMSSSKDKKAIQTSQRKFKKQVNKGILMRPNKSAGTRWNKKMR